MPTCICSVKCPVRISRQNKAKIRCIKVICERGNSHAEEVKEALLADKDFALAAFLYEMDNHEYAINYDRDGDVLGRFGLEIDDLSVMELDDVYLLARKKHFEHMREWGVI